MDLGASHGVLYRQPCRNRGLAGAGSAPRATGVDAGVGGDPSVGGRFETGPPPWGLSFHSLPLNGLFLALVPLQD